MKQPNFSELAAKYPKLWANITEKNSSTTDGILRLNWNDEKTQRILTTITLKDSFGINVNLPSNRLCPPVPNRLSYISWLSELIGLSFPPSNHDLAGEVRTCSVRISEKDSDESQALRNVLHGNEQYNDTPVDDSVATGLRSATLTIGSHQNDVNINVASSCSSLKGVLKRPPKEGCYHDEEAVTLPRHHILDIGVGASCIYPLLGHQQQKWR
jgi:RNA methyltransferase